MTIASTTTKQTMLGDDVTRVWPFTFRAWEDELRVIVADAAGAETDVTALSSVALDPGGAGGTVTYPADALSPALPAGRRIVIMRAMDFVQETRLVNVTRFDPAVIENQLDRLIANDQQLSEQVGRSLTVGVASGRDPAVVIDEVFLARDQAGASAVAAAGSEGAAAVSAEDAAGSATDAATSATAAAQALLDVDAAKDAALASIEDATALAREWAENPEDVPVTGTTDGFSAEHWAKKAAEAATGGVPLASPAKKGLVPAGGAARQVYRVNATGNAYGFEDALATLTEAGFTRPDGTTITVDASGVLSVTLAAAKLGDFKWSTFAPEELEEHEPGWYFMGGQGYAVGAAQAVELLKLPVAFRARWGIMNDGTNVYMPSMFYSDGRGYVIRAADGTTRIVGSVELDAFQGHKHYGVTSWTTAGTASMGLQGGQFQMYTRGEGEGTYTGTCGTPRLANETRVLSIGMTPVFYLGV